MPVMTSQMSALLFDLLACPRDHGVLDFAEGHLNCRLCRRRYPVEGNIPIFLTAEDKAQQHTRGTTLFEETPEYFQRLHTKRIKEWKTLPYLSEMFRPEEGWALDVGCGAGTLALVNAKRGIRSVGLDISLHGARLASENARKAGLGNCFFVVGDAIHLPFKEEMFGVISNYTTIEHLYDPEGCLQEMERVLAPGGRMIVNTINNFSIRPENGMGRALRNFIRELSAFWRGTEENHAHHEGASPASVTYETWKAGSEVDLYHALSYDLLRRTRMLFDIERYTTYSYPANGCSYGLTETLDIRAVPLPILRRAVYRLLLACETLPLLRHIGKTITLVARKRSRPAPP